jgi:transposase
LRKQSFRATFDGKKISTIKKEARPMKTIAYAGNDVHQETITVCVYVDREQQPLFEKRINNEKRTVEKLYKRLARDYEIRACYEASGNGYVFYRWLKEMGIKCDVIAPSLIPKKSGDRIKTDKRDAQKLARYYRNEELTVIHVPNEKEESIRSLVRLREQVSKEIRQSKQYLLKFLQARGLAYKDGDNWTQKHRRYLSGLKFEDSVDQRVFNEYLILLSYKEESLDKIDKDILGIAHGDEYRERVEKLMMLKGVRETTAMGLITEVVDFKRFGKARDLMGYLGLVPGERSSGEERNQGGITKTGNRRVRRLMIEAAWHYRHRPKVVKRGSGEMEETWMIAQRAQVRLYRKYWQMVNKGKCKSKAVTAVARELTGFVWAVMQAA